MGSSRSLHASSSALSKFSLKCGFIIYLNTNVNVTPFSRTSASKVQRSLGRRVRHYSKMSHFTRSIQRLNKCASFRASTHTHRSLTTNPNLKHFRLQSQVEIGRVQEVQDDQSLWVPSFHPEVVVPDGVVVSEFFRSKMGNWGSQIAVECGITGRKYTHDEVHAMSRSFAAALLQSKKFQHGDVIGIVSQNTPEYCPAVLGIIQAGLVASPVNPGYTNEEIARQLRNAGAKAAVVSAEYVGVVRALKNFKECPSLQTVIVTGDPPEDCHSFFDMAKVDAGGVEFLSGSQCDTKQQTCLLLYSSGTTGIPKGVELTHFNMISYLLGPGAPGVTNVQQCSEGRQERLIGVLPMFHVFGIAWFVAQTMIKGAHTMTLPRFHADTLVRAIRKHKPTALHVVPPLLNFIATSSEIGKAELSHLSTTVVGAAPFSEHIGQAFLDKVPSEMSFQHAYGMTEAFSATHYPDPKPNRGKLASCGRPVPNMITKIADVNSGRAVGRNQRGELWVKGPQIMKGYFNNEEATRECLDHEGWLRTGDIGYVDDEGDLFIVDRIKELIKVKGFQVAPSELEGLLIEHPEIQDVAVYGIPDDTAGELPRAAIVRRSESLSQEDVLKFLKGRVISYKQLGGGIDFVDSIPKAPSGKILRRELLRKYKETMGTA